MSPILNIPDPCTENWNNMPAEIGGRYCGSCGKVVKDFTQMSDAELIAYLQQNKNGECGRYREDQVNGYGKGKPFYYNFRIKAAAFFAVVFARLLNPGEAKAQDGAEAKKAGGKEIQYSVKNMYTDSVIYHISGTVNSKSTGNPIDFATIEVKINGKTSAYSAYTDYDGNFELNVPAKNSGDQISLSFHAARHKSFYIYNYKADERPLIVNLKKTQFHFRKRHSYVTGARF